MNYNFNKTSKHVKFFTWIWGMNPVDTYKTMCPYFWAYVVTIILLPIILLIKGVSDVLNILGDYMEKSSRDSFQKRIPKLVTDKDYYKFYNSKCYNKNRFTLEPGVRSKIYDIYKRYDTYLYNQVLESNKKKSEEDINDVWNSNDGKPNYIDLLLSKGTAIIAMILVTLLVSWGIYEIAHLFTMGEFVNFWKVTGQVILFIVVLGFLVFGIGSLVEYIKERFFCDRKQSVLSRGIYKIFTFIKKLLGWTVIPLFKTIIKGFRIFFDMIRNTYKKQCPIIHWEEEK